MEYFGSLNPRDPQTKSRVRLTDLRAEIIRLESEKERLIEIIEAHIAGNASGRIVSQNLNLSDIPNALEEIDSITKALISMAQEGDLFAAEPSFKQLMINFDKRRGGTLCNLAQEAAKRAPDVPRMQTLVQDLKNELTAISAAEEMLGKYIKESRR
jgi:hypothetical protein